MNENPFNTIVLSMERLCRFIHQVDNIKTGEAFDSTYGPFERQGPAVKTMQAALNAIRELGSQIGGPTELASMASRDPNALSPPITSDDSLAVELVKLASLTANAAQTVKQGLEDMTSMELTAQTTKQALAGPGGLATVGNDVILGGTAIKGTTQSIRQQIEPSLPPVSETILFSTALEVIATQERAIPRLSREVQEAQKAMDNAFFNKKDKRQKYEELSADLAMARAALTRKTAFRDAYEGLDTKASEVVVSLINIGSTLGDISEVFSSFRSTCVSMTTMGSDEQLSDPEWVAKALGTSQAISTFQRLNKQATKYVQQSMVSEARGG